MKPSLKQRRSYENAGAPRKEFEDLHPDNQVRRSKEFLKNNEMSFVELLAAARLKAEQEGFQDASHVIKSLGSNPIEQGEMIRNAMASADNDGTSSILLQNEVS